MTSCPTSTRILAVACLLATGLVAGACAQAAPPVQRTQQMHQRFVAADKDGNGQLTRAEARTGMPRIYSAFDQIDTQRKGFVTEAEITAAIAARLASRKGTPP